MNWVHRRNLPESLPLNDIIVPIPPCLHVGVILEEMMKAHVLLFLCLLALSSPMPCYTLVALFIDKTLPTVDVVILSLVGASAQQLSRVLMSINRTFPYLACSQGYKLTISNK